MRKEPVAEKKKSSRSTQNKTATFSVYLFLIFILLYTVFLIILRSLSFNHAFSVACMSVIIIDLLETQQLVRVKLSTKSLCSHMSEHNFN